jgi:glycosyltransferase involved in cell wall biosynthesis
MSKRVEIHQFLPTLAFRDAQSNITLEVKRALSEAGFRGGVWAEEIYFEAQNQARRYIAFEKTRAARRGSNVLIYQASTGSRGLVDFLMHRPEPKVIYYHNITPPHFFEPYEPSDAMTLARGRDELKQIAKAAVAGIADSEFNASELRDLGLEDVVVVPPYLPAPLPVEPVTHAGSARSIKQSLQLLFVGRVVPQKGHLYLLRVLAALRAGGDTDARLVIAGAFGPPAYMATVMAYRSRLGLEDCAEFTGSIKEHDLAVLYQTSDIFLSMSQHEGFGIPLAEAMRSGLPVVAYDAGAVAETLGGAGILIRNLEPELIAEVISRVGLDTTLRTHLAEKQTSRARELENFPRDKTIVDLVKRVASGLA